jgi:4-amino-4-deoxy-L-arabinose transferase-like glycosyltransferase
LSAGDREAIAATRREWRRRLGSWAAAQLRTPLFWILLGATVLRCAGLFWGLPASASWDSDAIAPRDFLVGVIETYWPGHFFTYPPLHLLLLTTLTLPGWALGLMRVHSLAQPDVIAELIQVPYMTAFTVVARLISAAMSLATIALVGKMTEDIAGRRAGILAAAVCALNMTLTYYGQVGNLDGPAMFWSIAAIWQWERAIGRREPQRFLGAAVLAAAATATKDQAAALFVLGVPLTLALWFAADPWPRRHAGRVLARLAIALGAATLLLLAVDGALTNPSGFGARLAFLLGPASRDLRSYSADLVGRLSLLQDAWRYVPRYYPAGAAYLGLLGLAAHGWRQFANRAIWAAGFLPLLAAVSFTVAFNFAALRTENRFLLPQSVLAAIYIGIGAEALAFSQAAVLRWSARVALLPIAGLALFRCIAVDAAMLRDPRYDAERWLHAHVQPGDSIEIYGPNAYLPRLPAAARVVRVGPTALAKRDPLPGVVEVQEPIEAAAERRPRFIVVSAFWASFYLKSDSPLDVGRAYAKSQQELFGQTAALDYVRDLFAGRLDYRLAHEAAYGDSFWPAIHVHESTAETIDIFERNELVEPPPATSHQ